MDRAGFIKSVLSCSCENCPISEFCEYAQTYSCGHTAKLFYDKVIRNKGGFKKWQYIKDLHLHQKNITRNR